MNSYLPSPSPARLTPAPSNPVRDSTVTKPSSSTDSFEDHLEEMSSDIQPRHPDDDTSPRDAAANSAPPATAPSESQTEENDDPSAQPSPEDPLAAAAQAMTDAMAAVPLQSNVPLPAIPVVPLAPSPTASAANASVPSTENGTANPSQPLPTTGTATPPATPTVNQPAPQSAETASAAPAPLPAEAAPAAVPQSAPATDGSATVATQPKTVATPDLPTAEEAQALLQPSSREAPESSDDSPSPQSEKIAESGDKSGKKGSPSPKTPALMRPFFISAEAFAKADGAKIPLETPFSAPDPASLGTQRAFQTDMPNLFTPSPTAAENAPSAVFGPASGLNAYHSHPIQSTESARLTAIVERIHQIVENAPIYPPRHITFQLDPPTLGKVVVDLKWTAANGWNVNWAVSQGEVRDWLAQQLPSLQQQQQNNQTPLVWHAPTLQNSSWEQFKQQSPFSNQQGNDAYLADEEFVSDEETPARPNEFWA